MLCNFIFTFKHSIPFLFSFGILTKSFSVVISERLLSDAVFLSLLRSFSEKKWWSGNSTVLSTVQLGKDDPFSEEGIKDKVDNLYSDFKLTGFLNTRINKYVFVSYLGQAGTITEESIGGVNTNLLPNGAKVLKIDPKKLKLIISFENEDYILEL